MLGIRKDLTVAVAAILVAFAVVLSGTVYYMSTTLTPANSTVVPSLTNTTPTPTGNSSSLVTLSLQSPPYAGPGPGSVLCGPLVQTAKAVSVGMAGGPTVPFSPQNITLIIGVNNTVTWTNNDPLKIPHTISSNQGLFDSGTLAGPFSCTFMSAGTYYYRCLFHPLMIGTVFVKSQ